MSDEGGMDVFHVLKYGSCVGYMVNNPDTCPYREDAIIAIITSAFALVGIINSSLCIMVFFQSKYNGRLLSLLLRFLYVSNLLLSLAILIRGLIRIISEREEYESGVVDLAKRSCSFLWRVTLKFSAGIHAFLSMTRFAQSAWPVFVLFSKNTHIMSYLILMLLAYTCVGINLRSFLTMEYELLHPYDVIPTILYYSLAVMTVVLFNILWIYQERRRYRTSMISRQYSFRGRFNRHSRITRNLLMYAMWSSSLFLTTTSPVVIFFLVPGVFNPISCSDCRKLIYILEILMVFMFCGYYLDNFWYCANSQQYVSDLGYAFRKLTCRRRRYSANSTLSSIVTAAR